MDTPSPDAPALVEDTASAPETKPLARADGQTGNAQFRVVLSCQKGDIPNHTRPTIPLNATFLRLALAPEFKIYGLEEEDATSFNAKIGSDGMADVWLPNGVDSVEIKVLPLIMDGDLPVSSHNIANDKDQSLVLERGKTVTKTFILEQAYCDEKRDIRSIGATPTTGATAFFAALESVSDDYDADNGIRRVGVSGPAAQKRFYTRTRASGDLIKGPYNGPVLNESRAFLRIRNIQTVRRVKRVCADASFNLDMTIRSDMALGIKSFEGTGPTGSVSCSKAYTTHMPVSLIKDYGDDDFFHTEKEGGNIVLLPENNSVMDRVEIRSSCASESDMMAAPFDWEMSCFEADQTSSKIFEYVEGDAVGPTHGYTMRFDLGGLEIVEGKVNPGVEF